MPKLVPLSPAKVIAVYRRLGFEVSKRKSGDHIIMRKTGSPRPLVIPDYREVPVFILMNLIRTAGIDRERFLNILANL